MSDFPNAPDASSHFNQAADQPASQSLSKPEVQPTPAHVVEPFARAAAQPEVHTQNAKLQLNYDMPGPIGNQSRDDARLQALPQKEQLSINTSATRALQKKIDRDKINIQKAKALQHEFNQRSRSG